MRGREEKGASYSSVRPIVQIWVFVWRSGAFIKRVDVGNGSQNGAEGSVGCYCWLHRLCTVCRVCDGSSATHC